MRFHFTSHPEEFAHHVGPFIEPRLECNVMATILESVRDGEYASRTPIFAYGRGDDGRVGFAALRTPPWHMLASELDPSHAPALIKEWLEVDPELPGANGLTDTARAIAGAWRSHTHGETACRMAMALHALTEVDDPPFPAPGRLRQPTDGEQDLLIAWTEEFAREAHLQGANHAREIVATRQRTGRLMLWDDGGPVSLVAQSRPVAGVARIGPVYTPPEHRRRGYASGAVAALSRLALNDGAHTCMLYTDLANPTSNKIYAEVGYRRFADWEEHAFGRA
jgi:uncharacterized protein